MEPATVPLWLEPEDVITFGVGAFEPLDDEAALDCRIAALGELCGMPAEDR